MRPLNISPSQAINYYYENDPIFQSKSVWFGNISKDYKICGKQCLKHDFQNLISGNDLHGNQIIKDGVRERKNGNRKNQKISEGQKMEKHHRAAVDIPFSAPKSVSVLALHFGDSRLIRAHDDAVEATLNYIEKEYICIRQTNRGTTSIRQTGEAIFALFFHSVSRDYDPQLHTHALILNHTTSPLGDGKRAVWFDRVFFDQVFINEIYHSELAKKVKSLGYRIDFRDNGRWEVEGVKDHWIKAFSKRSLSINSVEKQLIFKRDYLYAPPSKIRTIATLKSRSPKVFMDEMQLKSSWEKQVPCKRIQQSLARSKTNTEPGKKISSEKYLRLAYTIHHEKEALFKKTELFISALKLSRGECSISDLDKTFLKMRNKGEILHISDYITNKGFVHSHFTSREMKETEQAIFRAFQKGMNTAEPFIPNQKAKDIIMSSYGHLTHDQQKALTSIICSNHQFLLIQGDAGTGKTTALKALQTILEKERPEVEIAGLGYTGKTAQLLKNTGIESKTVSSFLNQPINKAGTKRLIICDEASMLGSFQANELINKIKDKNSRLVLIGDGKQLPSLSSGKIFRDLQDKDLPYVRMTQVLRQKSEHMRQKVTFIRAYQNGKNPKGIDDAFSLAQKTGNLIEKPLRNELIKSVADAYLKEKTPDDVLIITPANKDRIELNNHIRSSLQRNGKVESREQKTKISIPVSMTGIQRYFAENYSPGQTLFIERYNPSTEKKEYLDGLVVGTDKARNSLQILSNDRKIEWINLRDNVSRPVVTLYEKQGRKFSVNDRLVFTKNDRSLGIQNGTTGTLKKIDSTGVFHIDISGSQNVKIDPEKYPFLDHAYAVSCFKAQGTTCKKVLFYTDTHYKNLNKIESLYVAVSRAEQNIQIFTNDAQQLKQQFKEGQEKTSTMIPEKDLMKSNHPDMKAEKEMERE